MSYVTNIVLGIAEDKIDSSDILSRINTFFSGKCAGLVSCVDPRLPPDWYGGSKCLECLFAVGAFNYLEMDKFIAHCKSVVSNTDVLSLQLFVLVDEASSFELITIYGG